MEKPEIENIIHQFAHIIQEYAVSSETKKDGRERISIKILLKDNSVLEAFFVIIKSQLKQRYSFQWMQNNTLIIRWHNAPKHLEIGLHHKHIGTTENIHASEEMNLKKVLQYIAQIIGVLLLLIWFFW